MKYKEHLIKILVIFLVIVGNTVLNKTHLHYVNLLLLLVALFVTIYLRDKFFPYFTLSIGLFILATLQEILEYSTEPITLILHIAARTMFAVAVCLEILKPKT